MHKDSNGKTIIITRSFFSCRLEENCDVRRSVSAYGLLAMRKKMLTTICLLLVFYRSITMLYNNFSELWVVYNKCSINHENCIQIRIVLKKRRKLTLRAYTMWNIDEKPLLTIQELDHNIKRFACSSMFVIQRFFVCEMIRRYIYITKSTAIK